MRSRVLASAVIVSLLVGSSPALAADRQASAAPSTAAAAPAHTHPSPEPFSSNGCTGFREAKFFSCCYAHDLAYWAGGTRSERRAEDRALRRCLIDIGGTSLYDEIIADIGYLLVRMWTLPGILLGPLFDDGWGRAWRETSYGRYDALGSDQRRIVDAQKQEICSGLTLNKTTGRYRLADARELAQTSVRRICGDAFFKSH